MSYPNSNTFKIYTCAGLLTLFTGLPLGNVNSSFAVEPIVGEAGDIEMWIDSRKKFSDEATGFNNRLNTFIAAWFATDGNMEVVVLDRNTICISAQNGNCTSKATPQNRDMATEVNNKKTQVTILTASDE